MKLFITGISGLLGLNLALQGKETFSVSGAFHNHPVASDGMESVRLNITSIREAEEVFHTICPDVIVHTAAATNLEECESNPSLAHRLNIEVTHNVATIAASLDAKLVHISTDQLFDGTQPWRTETDEVSPQNAYAKTKLLAEQVVLDNCPSALIIRTNFFGWGTSVRPSFSDWILQGLKRRLDLTMFSDVFFTPILINHLVDLIFDLIRRDATGLFHVAGGDRLTKHAFALQLADCFGYSSDCIRPISIGDFPFKAQRPRELSLSSRKVESQLQVRMPTIAQGLDRLQRLQKAGWQQDLESALLSGKADL